MLISLAGIGAINAVKIHREYAEFALRGIAAIKNETPDPVYSFSKDGKNVLVIMLDRGINGFVPYVFEEKPELKSSFGGFTYYPNCVSFGRSTLFGASGLFGGYEYTPLEMQKRSDESLISKHDEALLVLPKLFLDNDYSVTVTDPPLAGYSWVPDLSCFNRYPEIRAEIVSEGNAYGDYWSLNRQDLQVTMVAPLLDAHLIRFSFFKSVPLVFRSLIYDQGRWLGPPGVGLAKGTINNYASLDILPDITTVTDGEKNSLIMLSNSLTHEPDFFQAPDYVPVSTVTDRGESTFANEVHYHANMAAYILLGKWFDFLKENGVYDNTRIIIVSDHGRNLFNDFPGNITLPNGECLESFGALLLVKDFNASGDLVTDNTFMTNADVPLLASQGIIGDPINPFTQVPLQGGKEKGITITTSVFNSPSLHGKYTFKINKDEWLRVHDNIFDPVNWEKVEL
jgi:hypothetical protein